MMPTGVKMMKKASLSLSAVLGVILLTNLADHPAFAEGTPRIVFEETRHDFGDVGQRQSVKHPFKFKNAGDATLLIENIKTTCGCTGTLLSKEKLDPGEEGAIEVTYTSGLSGGRKTKSVFVQSNDPEQPRLKLDITANVVVPVEVRPMRLYWPVKRNQESTRTIQLIYQPEHSLNVKKMTFTTEAFSASVRPMSNHHSPGYYIDITYDGSLPMGHFREVLTIETDNPEHPNLRVRVDGKVEGPVSVVPDSVSIGVVRKNYLPTRTIQVFCPDKKDFEITEVQPSNPIIATEIIEQDPPNRYRLDVTLTEAPPLGAFSEKLLIKTNHPDQSLIEVPVYAYAR